MTTRACYNQVVAAPALVFAKDGVVGLVGGFHGFFFYYADHSGPDFDGYGTPAGRERLASQHSEICRNAIEAYARQLLAHSAVSVGVPVLATGVFPSARSLKGSLAPSVGARFRFLDRRLAVWQAIQTYMGPIFEGIPARPSPSNSWERVAWALYLLVLAARTHSEVVMSPGRALRTLDDLESAYDFTREAKGRISVLKGVFGSYSEPTVMPGLRLLASAPTFALSDRLDDMLDDAYLREASEMRRLHLSSGSARIRKALRELLRFVAKHRPWAKGIVTAASYAGLGTSGEVLRGLIGELLQSSVDSPGPVSLDPRDHYTKCLTTAGDWLAEIRRLGEDRVGMHFWYHKDRHR